MNAFDAVSVARLSIQSVSYRSLSASITRISESTIMNHRSRTLLAACLVFVFAAMPAAKLSAATWTGNTNSDWFTASNWSGGVPTSGTTGDFNDPDPSIINGAAVASAINMTQGSLTLNSGSLTVGGLSQIGQGGFNPTFNQTGGDVFWNGGGLYVGNIVGSGADIYTYGGGTFSAAQLTIRGEGQFDHNNSANAMNITGGLTVASNTGNHVFNLNGNVLNLGGKLTIGTGSNTGSSSFNFGAPTTAKLTFTTSSGAIDVNGTNTFTVPNLTNALNVPGQSIIGGSDGFSVFTQQGGAVDFNGNLYVSNLDDGKKDQYNFNGGTLQTQLLTVYQWGEFNHNTSAELDVVTDLNLGTSATGNSIFNLNGNQVKVGGSLNVGAAGTGTGAFNFGNPATAKLTISTGGLNVGGSSTFIVPNLTNPLTVPGQSIVGGTNGFSVFTQNGGAVDFNGNLYISNLDDAKKDQYNFNGGTLQVQNLIVYQWGEFNHNASSELDIVTSLSLGNSATGNSFFNLNGNQVKIGSSLNIGVGGNTGSGTFNFGNPTTAKLTITSGGINIDGTNTFTVPNLTNPLTIPGQSIVGGSNGFSVFEQNGGAVDFNGTLYISNSNDGKKDQYNFNGGTLQVQTLNVYQWGEFNQNNASSFLDVVGSVSLGNSATGDSFFNMNGHEVKIGGNLEIGTANNTGSGTFSFGNPATAKLTIGAGINIYGKSTLVIPAGLVNPIVVPGQTIVGQGSGGESIYQQDGGTVSFNGQFYIANVANLGGETDKVILNGGTLNLNGVSSNINLQTRGAIIVNGGTLNAKTFNIGNNAGYIAGFESTGGTSNFAGTVKLDPVGDSDGDFINISGGTVNITGAGNDLELHGTGTATISGGLVNIVDDFLIGTRAAHVGIVNQTGGRVMVSDTLQLATVAGSSGTYNLSGGELKVGTLDLTNSGSDAFNLNGGKLSAVVVDNTDGILNYTSGVLSPGLVNNPATMTLNTGLTMPAAGGLEMDLHFPNTLGGGNDLLVVNGNLVLDGILSVNSDVPVGTFPILTFTGSLNDLGLQVLFPLTQSVFVQLNQGGGGTVFLTVIPVPEPSSMLLLAGLGLIGLQARRRTRCAA